MDPDESLSDAWVKSSSSGSGQQPFIDFTIQQQNLGGAAFLNYGAGIESQFSELSRSAEILSSIASEPNGQTIHGNEGQEISKSNGARVWDPNGMLNNLSFLEQKVHQLQEMVHLIIARRSQAGSQSNEILVQQQQLITVDLTSIIVQLISTAGSLLPSVKHSLSAVSPQNIIPSVVNFENVADQSHEMDFTVNNTNVQNCGINEHEAKDDEDGDDGENLPPGSYEILQLEKDEILAPHTHFCTICGKGFKRDANLRMHMRGHGDEYKTTAALAKPNKDFSLEPSLIRRYSCPFLGCKRNKDHKKFQPLKTILCVKNHYKRTHCDKSYICSRCHTKRFSVIADLKTHEKHCGKDRWLCSCGTTFSRKDKLFGHIALFQGHTPAIPLDDPKGSAGPSDAALQSNVSCRDGFQNPTPSSPYFSPLSFDSCGFPEFPRPPFEDSDSNFSFPSSFC